MEIATALTRQQVKAFAWFLGIEAEHAIVLPCAPLHDKPPPLDPYLNRKPNPRRPLRDKDKNCKPIRRALAVEKFFITFAKGLYPKIEFKVTGFNQALPYSPNIFDVVILNMVGPDINSLTDSFKNLATVLKPGGKIIMTIPNPKYTYPAAEWKRSIWDILLLRKPKLKLKTPPLSGSLITREFGGDIKINSHYYSLDAYIQAAASTGLQLKSTIEIKPLAPSSDFDLNYQLSQYPLVLLLEFSKP